MGLPDVWDGQEARWCRRTSFWARRLPGKRFSAIVCAIEHWKPCRGILTARFRPFWGWNRAILPMQRIGKMSAKDEMTCVRRISRLSWLPYCCTFGCLRQANEELASRGGEGRDPSRMVREPVGQAPARQRRGSRRKWSGSCSRGPDVAGARNRGFWLTREREHGARRGFQGGVRA